MRAGGALALALALAGCAGTTPQVTEPVDISDTQLIEIVRAHMARGGRRTADDERATPVLDRFVNGTAAVWFVPPECAASHCGGRALVYFVDLKRRRVVRTRWKAM
jgi:hypothetical protein